MYSSLSRYPEKHSDQVIDHLLKSTINIGQAFLFAVEGDKNYDQLVKKVKQFIFNNSKTQNMKFTLAELEEMTTFPSSVGETDELIENLYDDYKQITAKIHLADIPAKGDEALKKALGEKLVSAAKYCNELAKEDRWKTTLPTIQECFQPAEGSEVTQKNGDANISEAPAAEEVKEVATPAAEKEVASASKEEVVEEKAKETSEKKKRSKLTDETVELIRQKIAANEKQSVIAKEFGIDPSTVSDIKCNRGRYAKKGAVATEGTQNADAAVSTGHLPDGAVEQTN